MGFRGRVLGAGTAVATAVAVVATFVAVGVPDGAGGGEPMQPSTGQTRHPSPGSQRVVEPDVFESGSNEVGVVAETGVSMGASSTMGSPAAMDALAEPMVWEDCREGMFFGYGVLNEVRKRVPLEYELLLESSAQQPLLRVAGGECATVVVPGAAPHALTWALMDVAVVPPDGRGCQARSPVVADLKPDANPLCNWHTLFWASDSAPFVEWALQGTPDFPAYFVEDLSFEQGALDPARLGAPLRVQAGPPTPSPFVLESIVREYPVAHPLTVGFWRSGSNGMAKVTFETEDFAFGHADETLHADAASEMAELFGTDTPTLAPGLAPFGAARFGRAELRKEISVPAFAEDCHERAFVGPGDASAVRAAVPHHYELVLNPDDKPLLMVSVLRCERVWFAGNEPREVTIALFQAFIESPDGRGCQSTVAVVRNVNGDVAFECNWYTLWRAYDDPEIVGWFQDASPGYPAFYVENLRFERDAFDPSRLVQPFRSGADDTPSPFSLEGAVREWPGDVPVAGAWWWDGPGGTSRISIEVDDLGLGDGEMTLRPGSGSGMEKMFGPEGARIEPGYEGFAGLHWGRAELRREILTETTM